jgi:hypothetical protein
MFSPRGYIYVKHILFRELNEKKHNILENLKSVDVTSLPSAAYNRKNANFPDVEKLFGNLTFQ